MNGRIQLLVSCFYCHLVAGTVLVSDYCLTMSRFCEGTSWVFCSLEKQGVLKRVALWASLFLEVVKWCHCYSSALSDAGVVKIADIMGRYWCRDRSKFAKMIYGCWFPSPGKTNFQCYNSATWKTFDYLQRNFTQLLPLVGHECILEIVRVLQWYRSFPSRKADNSR